MMFLINITMVKRSPNDPNDGANGIATDLAKKINHLVVCVCVCGVCRRSLEIALIDGLRVPLD